MVFWNCKWCPLNYLITSGCGAGREGWVSGDTPHFTAYLTIPYFSHPPYILFVKIKKHCSCWFVLYFKKG